jgi:hypothetical protein
MLSEATRRLRVAPVGDFSQSLDGRGNLGDKFFRTRGRSSAEFGKMNHRDQLADPSQRPQEIVKHSLAERMQLTNVL